MNDKEQQILQEEFKAACDEFYVALQKYRDYQNALLAQEYLVQFIQSSHGLLEYYPWVKTFVSNKESTHLKNIALDCQSLSLDAKAIRKKLKMVKKPSRALLNKLLYKMTAENYQLQIAKQSYAIENALATFLGREGFAYALLDLPHCELSPEFLKAYQEQNQREMCKIAQNVPH